MASREQGSLAGYWPLMGDCLDHSGNGNHGQPQGERPLKGIFNGEGDRVSIPGGSLQFGREGFTVCAWIRADRRLDRATGDILGQFDAASRRGFSLCLASSGGGYGAHGNDRHLHFSVDDGSEPRWEPCGRPSERSNYVSNSLTAFDGDLYAATTDAWKPEDRGHVYRYVGGQAWADCGRVGSGRTRGVGPMIVHDGQLYAATWTLDWTRIDDPDLDYGRVYRYVGHGQWLDCGQPGENLRPMCMASYKGRLYVSGDDRRGGCSKLFAYEGGDRWRPCADIPLVLPDAFFPHSMTVCGGLLYIGTGSIYAYDGERVAYAGTPRGCTQVQGLGVYRGRVYAGTWPEGKVFAYCGGESWEDCGRLGDSTEVQPLTVYGGKLYAGSIPRAAVYRYEGGSDWSRLARFHAPEGWDPMPVGGAPGRDHAAGVREWSRLTSLVVFDGRLFASTGSCTGAIADAPCDVRGQVFAMTAGACASYTRDLGCGGHHVAGVWDGTCASLYVDGMLVATSAAAVGAFGHANDQPLLVGAGAVDYFAGEIHEVRVFSRALSAQDVAQLYEECGRPEARA